MKASAFEFRIRYLLHLVIYGLGFTAPWNHWLHLDPPGPNAHVWGILAATMPKAGIGSIGSAFDVLLGLGIAFALLGAGLRTWGAAYLGTDVVKDGAMHPGDESSVIADGPFRHLRNPLYVGTFMHTFALALLMPVSGAIFTIVMIGLLQMRLILGEEAFLSEKLGPAYVAYCGLVPRVWPVVKARVMGSGKRPRWGQAFVGEIYMWGVAASFAAVGWRYNASLLWQGVIVSLGVSLVARALLPKQAS
ncbi:isoprenylcysteine carboxylmethyltransferase family protein [Granulicella sp. WH15]|uniref:methyltransferase family protein n=1 Tax=Granulicella sp. WH15 TaxID=2602070 RepID=UPI0013676BEA|nr:isoprenylcysteine carboxylmethyltransferase family protein [Granulicella sp. WH15]QHN05234.1 isoprenylcysteine carboxylmethyltransferase family protein [Granulicella sp. WH15]